MVGPKIRGSWVVGSGSLNPDGRRQTSVVSRQQLPTATSPLNPKVSYIRVTVGKQVAFLVLGFFDSDRHGQVEVWYSGRREAIRLQDGRLIEAVGLATEWR